MSEDLKTNLLKDILTTGYPFEMEVTSRMQKKIWRVSNGAYYIDKDEQKGREIDVIAQLHKSVILESSSTLEVGVALITEVKKSTEVKNSKKEATPKTEEKPWVFFTSESTSFERMTFPKRYVATQFSLSPGKINKILRQNTVKVQKRLGRNFYQGFTGNGARDDIYKALSGTTKALSHFIEAEDYKDDESGDRILWYYEGVVIIKGKLFESFIGTDGKMQLNEVAYVQTNFNYLSPNYPNSQKNIIHVINENYLEEFLQKRTEELNNVFNDLKSQEVPLMELENSKN